jgi:recombination protein RecT
MSAEQLKTAVQGNAGATAVAQQQPKNFPAMLEKWKPEIARALPKHLNADRMARIALTEFRKNDNLAKCDPLSVFAAVIMLAQLGLEPGVLGQAFLVPYGKECQGIPGWKGLVDLVTRTGRATVDAQTVFEGDHFDYAKGTRPYIDHKESGKEPPDRSMFTHVYACGWVRGAEQAKFEVWTRERVIKHRDRFNKVGNRHYSFQHFEQYAKKVVLLQVLKYLPASPELQTAVELEHSADHGAQGLNIGNVIDGSWAPVEQPEQNATGSGQEREPFNKESAIAEMRKKVEEGAGADELKLLYVAIDKDFRDSGKSTPVDVEAVYRDLLESVKQKAGAK